MFSYLPFKICDPIHRFIHLNEMEKRVVDSLFFQRLHYIRQMGVVFLVYPGATHTRFEHSLGVMHLASRIYETLTVPHHLNRNLLPVAIPHEREELAYWWQIVRLGALCHDMGHLPFSHTAEKELFPEGGHEMMTVKIIQSEPLRAIWRDIPSHGRSVEEDILKVAVQEAELREFIPTLKLTAWEKMLSQVITEDNFGADRMDYLIRDAQYTGVGYGHFDYHQLMDTLRILPDPTNTRLTIGVDASGLQSVESLWISRYLMHSRVYHHPKCCIYSHHMRRFAFHYYSKKGFPSDLAGYLREQDATLISALHEAAAHKNYDACALLKIVKSFQELSLEGYPESSIIPLLKELQSTFQENIFVDYSPTLANWDHLRRFPVLSEGGKILPSSTASNFLRDIPIGSKLLGLFAHPEKVEEVGAWLRHKAEVRMQKSEVGRVR